MNSVRNSHADENQSSQVTQTSNHFQSPFRYVSIIHYRQSKSRTLQNKKEKKENNCKSLSDKDLGLRGGG